MPDPKDYLTEFVVGLDPEALESLTILHRHTGISPADLVNRSIKAYASIVDFLNTKPGARILMIDTKSQAEITLKDIGHGL
jgi:hypothetical protein